ncbi:MAG: DUF3037 domain-containing protein [Terriglobales bacterium]
MADLKKLEFFLLRYVPDAVKDEFVNVGLVMLEPGAEGEGFADVRFTRDWRRVRCLDPQADVEMLEALERDIRGQLGQARDREALLRKLDDSFSNLIQVSPTKGCLAQDPAKEIETIARLYFEGPKGAARLERSERRRILNGMREAFEQAGVWTLLMKEIPAAHYTKPGDPFRFDFGYRVGAEIKLFHAVSLKTSVEQAITLAARYPKIGEGIAQKIQAKPLLTAVIDDGLDRTLGGVEFALGALAEEKIQVATVAEMPLIAERARLELRA